MRYFWGGIAMLGLQIFCIVMQFYQGALFYSYVFNFVLSLGVMMWSARLFEDKQRTFGRCMRDYLPYLLQTVCVIAVDAALWLLVARMGSPVSVPDNMRETDVFLVVIVAYVMAGLPYIAIQILCAAIGFLIAAGFALADFIKRRR